MIDVNAWVDAARHGKAVGRCAAYKCPGLLFCPTDKDGNVTAFHDHTDRHTDVTIRWYEADCSSCGAKYAYPNGRDSSDGEKSRRDKRDKDRGRSEHRDAQRVSEFVGTLGGRT